MLPNNLREMRDRKGLSQQRLADIIGVNRATIRRWETGESKITLDMATKIAHALGVTTDELMMPPAVQYEINEPITLDKKGDLPAKEDRLDVPADAGRGGTLKVPVFEDFAGVCAGQGTFNFEGFAHDELEIPLSMIGGSYSKEPGRAPYIIRISGDSMVEADIPDGAQVLVNPILEADDGDTIIAEYFDDWMIKWVYWDRNGGGELRSASTKYPVRRFTREDVQNGNFVYKGKVCWVLNPPKRGE